MEIKLYYGDIIHASKYVQYKIYYKCYLKGTIADRYTILLVVPSKWYGNQWLIMIEKDGVSQTCLYIKFFWNLCLIL